MKGERTIGERPIAAPSGKSQREASFHWEKHVARFFHFSLTKAGAQETKEIIRVQQLRIHWYYRVFPVNYFVNF